MPSLQSAALFNFFHFLLDFLFADSGVVFSLTRIVPLPTGDSQEMILLDSILFMLLFLLRLGSIMRFVMNTLIAETLKTIPADGMRKGKHYEKQNEAYSE